MQEAAIGVVLGRKQKIRFANMVAKMATMTMAMIMGGALIRILVDILVYGHTAIALRQSRVRSAALLLNGIDGGAHARHTRRRTQRAARPSHGHDNLRDLFVRLHVPMRFNDVAQRKSARDDRVQFPG